MSLNFYCIINKYHLVKEEEKINEENEKIERKKNFKNFEGKQWRSREIIPSEPEISPLNLMSLNMRRKRKRKNTPKRLRRSGKSETPTKLQCFSCVQCFETEDEMLLHLKSEHKSKPHKCSRCRQSFAEKFELEDHLAIHDIMRTTNPKCEICGKEYSTNATLQQHTKDAHNTTKFPCSTCQRLFSSRRYLQEHTVKKHSGRVGPTCPICHKTFSGKAELVTHSTVHTGERPFKCHLCPKAFRLKSVLSMHVKSHLGKKDEVCDKCGLSFLKKSDLLKHMRRHNGSKPYKCDECAKEFIRKDYLVKHMKSHVAKLNRFIKPRNYRRSTKLSQEVILEPLEGADSLDVPIFEEDEDGVQVVSLLNPDQNLVIEELVDQNPVLVLAS